MMNKKKNKNNKNNKKNNNKTTTTTTTRLRNTWTGTLRRIRLQKMVEVHATPCAYSVRRPLHPGVVVAIVTAVSQQARIMATIQ